MGSTPVRREDRQRAPLPVSRRRGLAATPRSNARRWRQSRLNSPARRCDRTCRGKGSIVPRRASWSYSLRRACSASTVSAMRSADTAPGAVLLSSPPTGSQMAIPSSRWPGLPPDRCSCTRADVRPSPRIASSSDCRAARSFCGRARPRTSVITVCGNATDLQSCRVQRREDQQPAAQDT